MLSAWESPLNIVFLLGILVLLLLLKVLLSYTLKLNVISSNCISLHIVEYTVF